MDKSLSLYDLSSVLVSIHDEIMQNEGVLDDSLEARLDAITLDFDAKNEQIAKWSLNLIGKQAALDKEVARLQTKKKVAENLERRLKGYMKSCMERINKTKVELPTITIAVQKNPASVEIKDENKLPSKYKVIKQEVQIDKKSILADLKKGEKVEGAELITDQTHLRIT